MVPEWELLPLESLLLIKARFGVQGVPQVQLRAVLEVLWIINVLHMLFKLIFGLLIQIHLGFVVLEEAAVPSLVSLVSKLLLTRKLRVVAWWMSVLTMVASSPRRPSCRTS